MENTPQEELRAVLQFCCDVGLPVCFADMGYDTPDPALLRQAAEKALRFWFLLIHHMPFPVTAELLYDALIKADSIGGRFKKQLSERRQTGTE